MLRGGWTALMYACDSGSLNVIQLLLENGANPNAHKGIIIINHTCVIMTCINVLLILDMFSCLMALCCTKICEEEQLASCAELLIKEGAKVNGHDRYVMYIYVNR